MQHTEGTGRWHRARAATLGAVAGLLALLAAYAAWGGMLGELHRLERRSALRTSDAIPVLLWAALVLALLWAAVLIALATVSLLRGPAGGSGGHGNGEGAGPGLRPTGMIGRVAAVLLALTALSSLGSAAPAFAATGSAVATVSAGATAGAPAGAPAHGQLSGTDHHAKHAGNTADSCAADQAPAPGWVPDKPTRTEQKARDCAPLVTGKPVADDSGEVVVHRGDTLWAIAAAHLGPHADARSIAAEWPRWYAANRHVIGDDPDNLSIGTRLQTPDHVLEGSTR